MNPTELRQVAFWWACGLPIWEARTILRSSSNPDVRRHARELANRLFENLTADAQETVIAEWEKRQSTINQVRGNAA